MRSRVAAISGDAVGVLSVANSALSPFTSLYADPTPPGVAVHLPQGVVHVQIDDLVAAGQQRTRPGQPRQLPGGDRVELPDMAESERAQERPERRGRPQTLNSRSIAPCRNVQILDQVGAGHHAGDQPGTFSRAFVTPVKRRDTDSATSSERPQRCASASPAHDTRSGSSNTNDTSDGAWATLIRRMLFCSDRVTSDIVPAQKGIRLSRPAAGSPVQRWIRCRRASSPLREPVADPACLLAADRRGQASDALPHRGAAPTLPTRPHYVLEGTMALHSGHCRDHAPRPTQETRARRLRGKLLVGLGLLSLTAAVGVAFNALGASRNSVGEVEWKADDEVALMAAVGLSWVFVLIGLVINARQTRLSDALASAQIEERTRRMQHASFLSMKAVGNCGLEVAHNALAVLPTYKLAAHNDQLRFLNSLLRCYGTLALNSLPHNDRLPLAERTQLRVATQELQDGLLQFAKQRPNRHLQRELVEAAEALRVALALEQWYVGESAAPALTAGDLRRLYANELQSYCCWADSTTHPVQGQGVPVKGAVADARVPGLTAHVERCHVSSARHYLSPWYLTDDPPRDKPDKNRIQSSKPR